VNIVFFLISLEFALIEYIYDYACDDDKRAHYKKKKEKKKKQIKF
jgi:hypothetical protein